MAGGSTRPHIRSLCSRTALKFPVLELCLAFVERAGLDLTHTWRGRPASAALGTLCIAADRAWPVRERFRGNAHAAFWVVLQVRGVSPDLSSGLMLPLDRARTGFRARILVPA